MINLTRPLNYPGAFFHFGASAEAEQPEAGHAAPPQSSLTQLILFAASPGTITGGITIAVSHSGREVPTTALVAVGVGTAVMWLAIMLGIFLGQLR